MSSFQAPLSFSLGCLMKYLASSSLSRRGQVPPQVLAWRASEVALLASFVVHYPPSRSRNSNQSPKESTSLLVYMSTMYPCGKQCGLPCPLLPLAWNLFFSFLTDGTPYSFLPVEDPDPVAIFWSKPSRYELIP